MGGGGGDEFLYFLSFSYPSLYLSLLGFLSPLPLLLTVERMLSIDQSVVWLLDPAHTTAKLAFLDLVGRKWDACKEECDGERSPEVGRQRLREVGERVADAPEKIDGEEEIEEFRELGCGGVGEEMGRGEGERERETDRQTDRQR